MATPLHRLYADQHQSPWLDTMSRELITHGALQTLIDDGIRGATVNPTIFRKAVLGSNAYDEDIRLLARGARDPGQIYEALLIEDVRRAADVFRPLYRASGGEDGYVSIEVHPRLADDTTGTIREAHRFIWLIERPNIFVKVPATTAGIPAIRLLTREGVNVNVTLIFSVGVYDQVMDAYLTGLEDRLLDGNPLDGVRSVASFFVSRIDTEVDRRLNGLIDAEQHEARRGHLAALQGTVAIANAKVAYERFRETFGAERFRRLRAQGAHLQRPLWASTGTKNPAYRDVRYVEELIGPDSVTTIPPETVTAFQDHGKVERAIDRGVEEAHLSLKRLHAAGINLGAVTDRLLIEGIEQFSEALRGLEQAIDQKSETLPTTTTSAARA